MSETLEALLQEGRTFPPSDAFRKQALVTSTDLYDEAERDWQGFWARQALALDWDQEWTQILDWDLPFAKWFVGGRLNVSYNCLDRHVAAGHGDQVAFYWEGEPGDTRVLTYADMLEETGRVANALKSLGVRKGDRVAIYLGMVPELAITMLACARIGAAHSVVFGGFSSQSLRDRINDAEAKILVTADGAWRRGSVVELKEIADDGHRGDAVHRARRRPAAHRPGRCDRCEARRLVPRPRAAAADRVRVRVDGLGRPALSALHERHHREAQGHHAHDRRLPHAGRVHPSLRVRPASRHRRLLVHRRCRMGDGPLVRRLRTAREPRDERHVRRHARPSRPRPPVVDRREVQGDDLLHRADRDPDVHEVGRRRARVARPVVAALARHGRRTDQSRSVGLVLEGDRRQSAAPSSTPGGRPRPARS